MAQREQQLVELPLASAIEAALGRSRASVARGLLVFLFFFEWRVVIFFDNANAPIAFHVSRLNVI